MSTSWQDEYAHDTGREVTSLSDEEIAKEINALWYRGEMPRIVATLAEVPMLRCERDALRAELEDVRRMVRKLHGGFATTGTGLVARKGMRIAFPDLFTEADDGE